MKNLPQSPTTFGWLTSILAYTVKITTLMLCIALSGCNKENSEPEKEPEAKLKPNEWIIGNLTTSTRSSLPFVVMYYKSFEGKANVVFLSFSFADNPNNFSNISIGLISTSNAHELVLGKYTVSGKTEPFSIFRGQVLNGSNVMHELGSGEITISRTNDIYTVDFNGKSNTGIVIKGNYTGDKPFTLIGN